MIGYSCSTQRPESDTNNNIMRPKSKKIHVTRDPSEAITNSHITEEVRRSTRMSQQPKRLENSR